MIMSEISGRLVRVLIADDSAVVREFLRELIDAVPDMLVVGMAVNGQETVSLTRSLKPDLITMDVNMPRLDGVEAARQIMAEVPTPIAIVTGAPVGPGEATTFRAMEAGAVEVIAKPNRADLLSSEARRASFIQQLRNVARVGVVGIRRGTTTRTVTNLGSGPPTAPSSIPVPAGPGLFPDCAQLIAIGASTGGPPCIRTILDTLDPSRCPPVIITQHMSAQFLCGFAEWLNSSCSLNVHMGQSGQRLLPGSVYIAPGDRHLVVTDRGRIAVLDGPPVQYQKPSVDVLFQSVADRYGDGAIGVLLTGMGQDGALGLRKMFDRGAWTITQSKDSSLVYGMPGVAVQLGASRVSANPLHIGRLLRRVEWTNGRVGVSA